MSEKKRWAIDLERLHVSHKESIGTCLIAASFLAYTGAFSFEFRRMMVFDDWLTEVQDKQIPICLPFKIDTVLSNDVEISK